MTAITFASIREQGVEFVAVAVRDVVVNSHSDASKCIAALQLRFRRPVVLVGERNHCWYGRRDIVNFISRVPIGGIPWRKGTLN